MHGQYSLFSSAELSIGCIPEINIPFSKSLPFTNGVYLGQVETSVSVGNLYNYISYQPTPVKNVRDTFFLNQRGRTGTLPWLQLFLEGTLICMTMSLKIIVPPPCCWPSPWLRRCHQEIKSHPGWWNWHHTFWDQRIWSLSNQKFLPTPKNAYPVHPADVN